jgi:hypothetical protein
MGPYAVVYYNLTLSRLQSRLQHIYDGQPYARVDYIPQSGTWDLASVQGSITSAEFLIVQQLIIALS